MRGVWETMAAQRWSMRGLWGSLRRGSTKGRGRRRQVGFSQKVHLTDSKRDNSRFGRGVIVKRYSSGERIRVSAEITANHKGYFEFRLCPQVKEPRTLIPTLPDDRTTPDPRFHKLAWTDICLAPQEQLVEKQNTILGLELDNFRPAFSFRLD